MDAMVDDAELLRRYHSTFGLGDDIGLEHVRRHLDLELDLTRQLLASTPENRWETFERCYGELYASLPWLADTGGTPDSARWSAVLPAGAHVYEVGSGAGGMARELAAAGYTMRATDISKGRSAERRPQERLTWGVTDGVNLDRFETPESFDAVMSNQVIEHLHPDDLGQHFASCARILRPGGRYVVRTPHRFTGPHDVSLVFGFDRPVGMHLREYTNDELVEAAEAAGFERLESVVMVPRSEAVVTSRAMLGVQRQMERAATRRPRLRRLLARLRGPLQPRIFLVAHKAA